MSHIFQITTNFEAWLSYFFDYCHMYRCKTFECHIAFKTPNNNEGAERRSMNGGDVSTHDFHLSTVAFPSSAPWAVIQPQVLITCEAHHTHLLEQNGYMQQMEAQHLMWAVEGVKLCDSFPWPQYSPHHIVPSPRMK